VILLDTNLLVYAHRRAVAEHVAARAAIERALGSPGGAGLALASVAELVAVVTHPKAQGGPSSIEQATRYLELLERTGGLRVLLPRPGAFRRLLQLARALAVSGPRIFDLQIALTGLDHGATELWTHDRHFVPVPGIELHDPLG